MTISNDIRPKKVSRPKPHKKESIKLDTITHQNVIPESIQMLPEVQIEFEERETLEDQFFSEDSTSNSNVEISAPKRESITKTTRINIWRTINAKKLTWFFVIIILIIVIYQNYTDIVSSLKQDLTGKTNTEENTTTNTTDTADTTTNVDNVTTTDTTQNANTPAEVTTPQNTATTNTATTDKSQLKLRVLNGNGITGSADKLKTILTTSGYTVPTVSNAKSFSYSQTYIYYKTGKIADAEAIKAILANYSVVLENSDTVVGNYDLIIVVGKK